MARKFQNVSGKDQMFILDPKPAIPGQYWPPEKSTVTVPPDGIVEGDYWGRYAGPGGPLREI